MDLFHSMQVFTKVFEEQNFSKVSEAMQMNTSSVSRIISRLEEELSAPLFIRNTRKMVPTEVGELFYLKAQEILKMVDSVKVELKSYQQKKIKIHIGPEIADFFMKDILKIFNRYNPKADFELIFDSQSPDIIQENIDFSISLASLKDSGLIARKIVDGGLALCHFGQNSQQLVIPEFLKGKISKKFFVNSIEQKQIEKILYVSDFSKALNIAESLNCSCILPAWYQSVINQDMEAFNESEMLSLVGHNYGLYLIYTYNRYKKESGKEIVDDLLMMLKRKLNLI